MLNSTELILAVINVLIVWIVILIVASVTKAYRYANFAYLYAATGIVAIIIIWSYIVELTILRTIMFELIKVAAISTVVLFQPEIRRAIDKFQNRKVLKIQETAIILDEAFTKELLQAIRELSLTKTGALITLENRQSLESYMTNATMMSSQFSKELLKTIFNPATILHDGAVIIKNNQIIAASVYFPVDHEIKINKKLGTRHLAALSISTKTDSLSIIVSEETGVVSLAQNGNLEYNVDLNEIRKRMGA
jgi:diadenylate cyclase